MGRSDYNITWDLYNFYSLLVDGCYIGMMVETDAGIDILHDVFYLPGYCLIPAEHEDGRPRARDAAAEGAGLFAALLYRVESGDQHTADRFDDDVFEGAADQVKVLLDKPSYQSGDIAPLADSVFEQDMPP